MIRGSFQEPKTFDKLSSLSPSDVTASGSGLAQKKHSTSWWPFGARNQEEEEKRKEGGLEKTPEKKDGAERSTPEKRDESFEKTPEKKETNVVTLETCREQTLIHATENVVAVEITTAVETVQVEMEDKSAPKMITRYSIGTQTTFLDEKSMNLESTEIENEQASLLLKGKEKFRKTLRLSNDAIVSYFTFLLTAGCSTLSSQVSIQRLHELLGGNYRKLNSTCVLLKVFIRDKYAYVPVVTNCQYSVAQFCTEEECLPARIGVSTCGTS